MLAGKVLQDRTKILKADASFLLRLCQRCLQSRQEECPISKPVFPESKNRLIVIRIQGFFAALSILKFRQKFLLARQGNGGIFFIYKPCKFTEHLEDVFS